MHSKLYSVFIPHTMDRQMLPSALSPCFAVLRFTVKINWIKWQILRNNDKKLVNEIILLQVL